MFQRSHGLTATCALALAVSAAPVARADDARLQDQITQYRVIIEDLKKSDTRSVATGEIARLASWLTEAQTKLATGDEDKVEILLRRFKPQVAYSRGLIALAATEAKLAEMKETNQAYRDEAGKLKARSRELEKRRSELKAAVDARKPDEHESGGLKEVKFGEGQ